MAEQFSLASEYRPTAISFLLGVVWLFLFAGIAADRVTLAVMNFDGTLNQFLLSALFWGYLTLGGFRLIYSSLRVRLAIDGQSIIHRGIIRTQSIALSDVQEIEWSDKSRCWVHYLRVRVCDAKQTIQVTLGYFDLVDQIQIVAFFRRAFPEECQRNWEQFAKQFPKSVPLDTVQRAAQQRETYYGLIGFTVMCLLMFVM